MTAEDLRQLRRLHSACFPGCRFPQGSFTALLLTRAGRIDGFAIVRDSPDAVAFERYGVSKRWRRKGFGRSIVKKVVRFAGPRPVRCYVAAWNHHSINVLFSCGFRAYTYAGANPAFVNLVHSHDHDHRRPRRRRNASGDVWYVRHVRHPVGGAARPADQQRRRVA